MPLTPADVRNKQFSTTRLRLPGYDEEEVDAFLDEVEAELDRLIQENEELRSKLSEVLRGGGKPGVPALSSPLSDSQEMRQPEPQQDMPPRQPDPMMMGSGMRSPIEPPEENNRATNMDTAARVLSLAQQAADQTVVDARREANETLNRARQAADEILNRAHREADTMQTGARRWLEADIPASVPLDAELSMLVRVSAYTSDTGSERVPLRDFNVGPAGAPVTIIVQTRRGLSPTGPLEQLLLVPEARESDPARFTFHAEQAGLFRIRVTAFVGGTFLGELVTELVVEAGGQHAIASTKASELAPVRAKPGEVTLQVRSDGERYIFQLLSETCLFEPVIAQALTAQPGEAVERAVTTLRMIANATSGYTGKNARTWMEETGIGLWNDMVPSLIKEQFWQLRSSISAFSIASGYDTVPWELLYPLSPGNDEGFLVEQFPVLRRAYDQHRSRHISLSPSVFVAPPGSPGNAQNEINTLRHRFARASQGTEVRDLANLLDTINVGTFGLLHFACHNTFRPGSGGSSIQMEGGRFTPELLNRAVVKRPLTSLNPLVFINACRSADAVPEYTKLMGWAQQFMGAGAGAFVGTLWAVRSESASIFAEAFYDSLLTGQSLGQATHTARAQIAADSSDPTWLAYTVYGDPSAIA